MANPIRYKKEVEELARILDEQRLTEIEYEAGGLRIRVARKGAPVVAVPAGPVAAADAGEAAAGVPAQEAGQTVRSPMVGTFYVAASPESPPFVGIGDRVRKGQVICIIEAMKLMNEIESEYDGVVAERLVENAQGVEFEQPLFRITAD